MKRRNEFYLSAITGIALGMIVASVWYMAGSSRVPKEPAARRSAIGQFECGQWSVLRVCELLGQPIDMRAIVDRLPSQSDGHSLLQLSTVLRGIGFEVNARQESMESLRKGSLPCIAFIERPEPHFAVLSDMADGFVHVFDCHGRRMSWTEETFENRWGGKVLWVSRSHAGGSFPMPSPGAPRIQFDTLIVDKGNITMGAESVLFKFPFRNLGDGALEITDVGASCNCIRVHKPNAPIVMGDSEYVELELHGTSKKGPFLHEAVVRTNDPLFPAITLKLAGNRDARVQVSPSSLSLGNIAAGTNRRRVCFLKYTGDQPDFRVVGVESTIPGTSTEFYSTIEQTRIAQWIPEGTIVKHGAPNVWAIEIDVAASEAKVGDIDGSVFVTTNVPGFERVAVRVSGRIIAPVRIFPSTVNLAGCDSDNGGIAFSVLAVTSGAKPRELVGVDSRLGRLAWSVTREENGSDQKVTIQVQTHQVRDLIASGVTLRFAENGSPSEWPISLSIFSTSLDADVRGIDTDD